MPRLPTWEMSRPGFEDLQCALVQRDGAPPACVRLAVAHGELKPVIGSLLLIDITVDDINRTAGVRTRAASGRRSRARLVHHRRGWLVAGLESLRATPARVRHRARTRTAPRFRRPRPQSGRNRVAGADYCHGQRARIPTRRHRPAAQRHGSRRPGAERAEAPRALHPAFHPRNRRGHAHRPPRYQAARHRAGPAAASAAGFRWRNLLDRRQPDSHRPRRRTPPDAGALRL